jgi:hypothetical protein
MNGSGSAMTSSDPSLSHEELAVLDPTPDVHALFVQYNEKYFHGTLGAVIVTWSKRMTLYACITRLPSSHTHSAV